MNKALQSVPGPAVCAEEAGDLPGPLVGLSMRADKTSGLPLKIRAVFINALKQLTKDFCGQVNSGNYS